jgi:NAD(P)H-nitrite reductase large subunit
MKKYHEIMIVGGGIAAVSALKCIRENDNEISTGCIYNEPGLPYKRTRINKAIATGFNHESFQLLDKQWYIDNNITLYPAQKVESISNSNIHTSSGEDISYDRLILATGAVPYLPNPFKGIMGIETIRKRDSVLSLIDKLHDIESVLLIGGGILSLETAYQLRSIDKDVTIVTRGSAIVKNKFSTLFQDRIRKDLAISGIKLCENSSIDHVERIDGGYRCRSGKMNHEAELVIVCAGIVPQIELAIEAGLDVDVGIKVDKRLMTSNRSIFACGDAVQHPDGSCTGLWHAAETQGRLAGLNVLGYNHVYQNSLYRLKTTLLDTFYFSMISPADLESIEPDIVEKETRVCEFYYRDDTLCGVCMLGDKDNARLYDSAVKEEWTRSRVASTLY